MESILFVGLYPPSNVERALYDAKQRLFRTFASISALALGPVIPLCYEPSTTDPPSARTLPHGIALETGSWTLVERALMLSVEPADRFEELAQALGGKAGGSESSAHPLPVFPGVYMARADEAGPDIRWPGIERAESYSAQDMMDCLGSPPHVGWSVSDAVCWRLEIANPHRWWNDVKCRELWRVRLRKGSTWRTTT